MNRGLRAETCVLRKLLLRIVGIAVLAEDDPMSIPSAYRDLQSLVSGWSMKPNPSGRTALVPGYMAGVEAAHRRFGKLPFKSIFAPAIDIAEKGFKLEPAMDVMIYTRKDILSRLPETKQIFLRGEDGNFYRAGDVFRQPELAATLRAVSEQGSSYMYIGYWAKKLVAAVQRDGGKMTMEDLRNYRAIWSEPIAAFTGAKR